MRFNIGEEKKNLLNRLNGMTSVTHTVYVRISIIENFVKMNSPLYPANFNRSPFTWQNWLKN